MKQIILAITTVLITASVSMANPADSASRKEAHLEKLAMKQERINERNNIVSNFTKQQFYQDFPDAKNVLFEKALKYEEASFNSGRHKVNAYYDNYGKLIGTTQKKKFSDLSESAQKEILKKYAGYNITDVIKFDYNEDNDTAIILYGTPFDADNYFVEMSKGDSKMILKVSMDGNVNAFNHGLN